MGKRTYLEDIISLSLLYRKEFVGTDMITYNKILEFDRMINDNLDNINSQCFVHIKSSDYVRSDFYRIVTDENGNKFAVILPNADLRYVWKIYVGCLPLDVLAASQMDNALEIIGLQKVIKNGDVSIIQKGEEKNKDCKLLKLIK